MPLANTIVWGLSMATLLTLFIIPALYTIADDLIPNRYPIKKEETVVETPTLEPEPAD
jgi:hypothetical protein